MDSSLAPEVAPEMGPGTGPGTGSEAGIEAGIEAGPATGPDIGADAAARVAWNADGLVPAIAQRHDSGEVLMFAWMNEEALRLTLTTGRATYYSRSRRRLWVKGEESGHHQYVRSVALDCDGDAVLVQVEQVGASCHTGEATCFFTPLVGTATLNGPTPAQPEEEAP